MRTKFSVTLENEEVGVLTIEKDEIKTFNYWYMNFAAKNISQSETGFVRTLPGHTNDFNFVKLFMEICLRDFLKADLRKRIALKP